MRLRRKGSLSVVLFLPCVAPLANAQQPMVPISLVSSTQSAVVGQPMTFTATTMARLLSPRRSRQEITLFLRCSALVAMAPTASRLSSRWHLSPRFRNGD